MISFHIVSYQRTLQKCGLHFSLHVIKKRAYDCTEIVMVVTFASTGVHANFFVYFFVLFFLNFRYINTKSSEKIRILYCK